MVPKLKTLKRSVRDGNAGYLLGDLTRKNITKIRSPCPKIITWVRSGVPFSKWIRLNLTHEVRMRCAAVTKQNIIISDNFDSPNCFLNKKILSNYNVAQWP
jgi:hypothetical protein